MNLLLVIIQNSILGLLNHVSFLNVIALELSA